MTPNTECAHCHKPLYRPKGLLADNRLNYCDRICFQAQRKEKKDDALEYVAANMDTLSIGEMATHLQISRDALSWRMATWRAAGMLKGQSRTYNRRTKPVAKSKFFDWIEFENDVIVGGNLYPDEVVGFKGYGMEIARFMM